MIKELIRKVKPYYLCTPIHTIITIAVHIYLFGFTHDRITVQCSTALKLHCLVFVSEGALVVPGNIGDKSGISRNSQIRRCRRREVQEN